MILDSSYIGEAIDVDNNFDAFVERAEVIFWLCKYVDSASSSIAYGVLNFDVDFRVETGFLISEMSRDLQENSCV